MLTVDQVNAIWNLLYDALEAFTKKHGAKPIKQSAALEEIVASAQARSLIAKSGGAFSREQILEAYCLNLMEQLARSKGHVPISEMS